MIELPASQGEQLYHALLRKNGWSTYEPAPPVKTQVAELEAAAAQTPWMQPLPEAEAAYQRLFHTP